MDKVCTFFKDITSDPWSQIVEFIFYLRLTPFLNDLPIFRHKSWIALEFLYLKNRLTHMQFSSVIVNSISSKSKPVLFSLTRFSTIGLKAEIKWNSDKFFRKDFEERLSAVVMSFSSRKKITGQPACFSLNWRHRFSVRFPSSAKVSVETGKKMKI